MYTAKSCYWMSVWFVVDSRQPANNKAGCMGHIHQHSRVMSLVFLVLFLFLLFFCFFSGCICVCLFNCIGLSCCHYDVIKHDDDDDDDDTVTISQSREKSSRIRHRFSTSLGQPRLSRQS